MRRHASARLSAGELDQLLEADQHFTDAFRLAEPFFEDDDLRSRAPDRQRNALGAM
jgi:hypothetical protein